MLGACSRQEAVGGCTHCGRMYTLCTVVTGSAAGGHLTGSQHCACWHMIGQQFHSCQKKSWPASNVICYSHKNQAAVEQQKHSISKFMDQNNRYAYN